jgi:hypothetical protein
VAVKTWRERQVNPRCRAAGASAKDVLDAAAGGLGVRDAKVQELCPVSAWILDINGPCIGGSVKIHAYACLAHRDFYHKGVVFFPDIISGAQGPCAEGMAAGPSTTSIATSFAANGLGARLRPLTSVSMRGNRTHIRGAAGALKTAHVLSISLRADGDVLEAAYDLAHSMPYWTCDLPATRVAGSQGIATKLELDENHSSYRWEP